MYAMAHTFEIIFTNDVGHRWRQLHSRFRLKERMIAFFIRATIIWIIVIIVMKKCRLAADGARRIFSFFKWKWFCTFRTTWNKIRCKLMFTFTALVFLIAEFIFAVFIKWMRVALWATNWYNIIHEILYSFLEISGGIGFRGKTIIPQGVQGLNFHLT